MQPRKGFFERGTLEVLTLPIHRTWPCAGAALGQGGRVDKPAHNRVFKVVDGVSNIVSKVHHLRLQRHLALRQTGPQPLKHLEVVIVDAELLSPTLFDDRVLTTPGIFGGGVQTGATEIKTGGLSCPRKNLGLQTG